MEKVLHKDPNTAFLTQTSHTERLQKAQQSIQSTASLPPFITISSLHNNTQYQQLASSHLLLHPRLRCCEFSVALFLTLKYEGLMNISDKFKQLHDSDFKGYYDTTCGINTIMTVASLSASLSSLMARAANCFLYYI